MRFWHEAIQYGLGHDDTHSSFAFFGSTARARTFRVQVDDSLRPAWTGPVLRLTPKDDRTPGLNRTRGWFLPEGLCGPLDSEWWTNPIKGQTNPLGYLAGLLRFIGTWASLGAKPQLGYGVMKLANPAALKPHWPAPGPQRVVAADQPDLRAFTFFKLRFQPDPRNQDWWQRVPGIRELRAHRDVWPTLERLAREGMVPVSPALRNMLRYGSPLDGRLAGQLFGCLKPERLRSKVAISWAYRDENWWEIRGWAWLPRSLGPRRQDGVNRLRQVLSTPQTIYQALGVDGSRFQSQLVFAPAPQRPWEIYTAEEVHRLLQQSAGS